MKVEELHLQERTCSFVNMLMLIQGSIRFPGCDALPPILKRSIAMTASAVDLRLRAGAFSIEDPQVLLRDPVPK